MEVDVTLKPVDEKKPEARRSTTSYWPGTDAADAGITHATKRDIIKSKDNQRTTALFHKNLQISPGEYIRRAKLQESKLMIREGKMNFTEIAQVLQYSTVHHFSRQFKEKFGITPTEYARSIR